MFLQAISPQRAAAPTSVSRSTPPPTGGWDTESNIAQMPKENAVILDNWFPDSSEVIVRRGFESFSTGMAGDVETLMSYEPEGGSRKLFAANAGKIYSIGAGGAVGAAAASGFTNNRWQYVNIGTSGGRYLFACNGADTPQIYDGASFADTGLTGPTVDNVIWCNLHQTRLWIGEVGKLTAWYGAPNAITGAFSEFPLYGVATLGGYLMGMVTWSRDSGAGQDDVAVFITSEGEAIVYSGTDPSSASTWALVGVFRIGKPIGRRFFIKAGADAVVVTEDGFVSLASILYLDRTQSRKAAVSRQINKAVNAAVQSSSDNFGWQPILYPRGTMLLVNIPLDGLTSHQYVFNTLTGKPCRFTGQNANCWAVYDDNLYFGGKDGKVYKADTGTSDNSMAIDADMLPAFSYFGNPGDIKSFKLAEALFRSDGQVSPSLDLNVDFSIINSSAVSSPIGGAGTAGTWDESNWDQANWGGDSDIYRSWKSVRGVGRAAALRIRLQSSTVRPSLVAINYIFQPGGYLR